MSTKQVESIRTQAMKSIQNLSRIIMPMLLVEKSMSKQTMDTITIPIGQLESWENKKKLADELSSMLQKSKTEQEILQKAKMIINKYK